MSDGPINHRWWEADRPAEALVASCDEIARRDMWRTREILTSWRLFGGRRWDSLRKIGHTRRGGVAGAGDNLVRFNVIASVVETLVARLSKSRPAPQFVTNGADYKVRRQTDKLNKFGKGVLHASRFYEQLDLFLRDACATGTCAVKFCAEGKKITAERALTWELFVPPWESERGDPRTLMQRTPVDRSALVAAFGKGPGKEKRLAAIKMSSVAADARDASVGRLEEGADMVDCYEGWHLGSKDTGWEGPSQAGRHVVAVSGGLLVDEEWTADRFPFAFMRWDDPPVGFWGIGVASHLEPIQYEINNLLRKIQIATHLHAHPPTFIDSTSDIPDAHITNDAGAIIRLPPGTAPPTRVVVPIMSPEVYGQVDSLIARAYEREGVSQMSAGARKPTGLDSAVALREWNDVESERHIVQGRKVERFTLDAVEVCLTLAESIKGYEVDTMDARWNERMKWSDIRVAREKFVLQCFPVSMLPQTPAARLQFVQEMAGQQWITPQKAKQLLDMPDIEEEVSLVTASADMVRRQIERILDGEVMETPEPNIDLPSALEYTTAVLLREQANGAPPGILDQLRAYHSQLARLVGIASDAQAAATAPAPQPGMPPAVA